jgi:lysophospholipase L1-like esterase
VITWPTPAAIVYGTALSSVQLDASTTVPGTFTYNPSLGKLLSAGSHTLSVNFVPTDSASYKSSTASTALTVTQATPQIEWAPAGPFAAGMPLGTAQLDASAMAPGGTSPLPGTFVYSPDAGTVVASSGPQTFAVTFTPNDDVDYVTAEANASLDVLPFGVVAWGDSLTDGEDGLYDLGAYPADLVSLLVLPVINEGVGGQTSTQIGVREGAVPTYVTVAGGVIPASGGVKVTFQTGYEPVTISGPSGGTSGTILGVHGTVTIDSGDTTFTFTRTTQGSAVNAPGHPPLAVDKPYDKYIPIFWEGRNNLNEPSQVLSDLAAQVASVSAGQNYAVLSITNINTPDEWVGGTAYRSIQELNAELSSNFGSHYLDIRKTLVESYNPDLITDVSDFAHDEIPTSLRAVDTQNATLRNSIGPSDTTLTIETSNVSALRIGAILTVDTGDNAENMCIATVNGNTVTVRRNYGGNKTSHAAGVPVVETDETHLNAQGYQVVANAVAQYLSAYEVSK